MLPRRAISTSALSYVLTAIFKKNGTIQKTCWTAAKNNSSLVLHSSVFSVIPVSEQHTGAKVSSLSDCMLTDSTTLISVSSSYFISFCRLRAEKNTSCVFCRVGGQADGWMCWSDFLRTAVMLNTLRQLCVFVIVCFYDEIVVFPSRLADKCAFDFETHLL